MDEQQRRLERQGATGDPEAKAKALQHELESGHWEVVQCLECVATDRTPGCKECAGHGYVRVKLEDLLPLRRREPTAFESIRKMLAKEEGHEVIQEIRDEFDAQATGGPGAHPCCGRTPYPSPDGGPPWGHSHTEGVSPHMSYMEECICCRVQYGEHTSDPVAAERIVPDRLEARD